MPPAQSIRDLIVDNLVSTYSALAAGAEYNYTTNATFRWRTPGPEGLLAFPCYSILDLSERVSVKAAPLQERILTLLIQGVHMVGDGDDPDGVGRKMLADAQKALVVDPTRGGVAVDTKEAGNRLMVDAPAAPFLVVELDVEVYYRTAYGNPASASP